jgi:hypothetical protein
VQTRPRSLEQLMPFDTAGELLAKKKPAGRLDLVGRHCVASGGAVGGVRSVRDLMGSLVERHELLLRKLGEERVTPLFPYPSSY